MPLPYPRLTPASLPQVDVLYTRCAAFFALVDDPLATGNGAADLLSDRPPDFPLEDKYALGVFQDDALLGVIDFLVGYPKPDTAFVGLLLIDPDARGRGLGAQVFGRVQAWLVTQGIKEIRLGVQMNNPRARRFWERQGFIHLEDRPLLGATDPTPTVHLMGKDL